MAVWNAMFCDIVLPPCANQASPLISNLPYCRDIAFSLATSRPFPPLGRHGGGRYFRRSEIMRRIRFDMLSTSP